MLSEWTDVLAALPPLAELLLKLTLLLAVAWFFKPLLHRASPRWQVLYWRGVASAALLLPVVVPFGPTVPVALPERDVAKPMAVANQGPVSAGLFLDQGRTLADHGAMPDAVAMARETAAGAENAQAPAESDTVGAAGLQSVSSQSPRGQWAAILAVAWLLPAMFLLAGALIREWRTVRLVRRAVAAPETTSKLLAQVARALGYARPIRVCISSRVDSPLVTGLFRPAILLPETFEIRDRTDLGGILAHEVDHLAAHDLIWSRVIQLLSIGLWFHPLVWCLGRQHLDACERASDGAAAEYVGDADAYAGTLARVTLGVMGRRCYLAGVAMARTSRIQERLVYLSKAMPAAPLRRRQVVPVVAGGVILLMAVGGLRLVEAGGTVSVAEARDAVVAGQAAAGSERPGGDGAEGSEPAAATKYECRLVDVISGEPVAGAVVKVQRMVSGGGKSFEEWPVKRETDHTTDAEGRYTIDILPEESEERRLYIQIRSTKHPDYVDYFGGYSYSMIKKNMKMGSRPFFESIRVWPAVKLRGTVVTPDGEPAAGVQVFGYSKLDLEKLDTPGFFIDGKTNDEGVFELKAVRGGKAVVWLSPKDYCPSTHVVESRAAELGKTMLDYLHLDGLVPGVRDEAVKTRDVGRLVLEDGIRIQGRVVDVDGTPIEGVWVNAGLQEGPAKKEIGMQLADHIDRSALTDADGRYRMGSLPPSTYRVTPWEEPQERSVEDRTPRPVPAEFFPQTVTLKEDAKIATVDFQAVPDVTVVAQYYRSSGEPRSGSRLHLSGRIEGEFYWKRCHPDAKGRIEVTVPTGLEKASLSLITNEHSALRHRITKDGPLMNANRVELGTISSDMKEIAIIRYVAPILLIKPVDEDGQLIKDAFVKIGYAPGKAPHPGEFIRDGRSGGFVSLRGHGDGRWRTSQLLPDEELTITVEARGYETQSETLSLPEGETREIDVRLKRTSGE